MHSQNRNANKNWPYKFSPSLRIATFTCENGKNVVKRFSTRFSMGPIWRTPFFFRLRLGQSLYELGDEQEAANWLVPVYLMEGRTPFEIDGLKYLEFFRNKLKEPQGGWPDGW